MTSGEHDCFVLLAASHKLPNEHACKYDVKIDCSAASNLVKLVSASPLAHEHVLSFADVFS